LLLSSEWPESKKTFLSVLTYPLNWNFIVGFSCRRRMVWSDFSFSKNQTNKTPSLCPLCLCGDKNHLAFFPPASLFQNIQKGADPCLKAGMGGVRIDFEITESMAFQLLADVMVYAGIRTAGETGDKTYGQVGIFLDVSDPIADLTGKMPDIPWMGAVI